MPKNAASNARRAERMALMAAVDRERFLNNIGTDAARLNHPVSRLLDPARADMAETAHDVATDATDVARCVADAFNGNGFGV